MTLLYEDEHFSIARFWGGDKRGVCVQITERDGHLIRYIQVTQAQFKILQGINVSKGKS